MTKLERLEAFFTAREEAGDWRKYLNKAGTRISRQRVVEGCQFPRSTLYQAAAIQMRLVEMEANLRQRGIVRASGTEEPSAPNFDGEADKQLDALNARIDTLLGGIQEMRAFIASFGTDEMPAS
ncbi:MULTISPECIES: hypothetical protein [Burkholderia]|uniref:hypothetical protein n=1 Tax=Burkholderia TaxID=32008 RepID=UPI000F545E5B|nr:MULTISPECIES: hypothetical protein [Burkholderia]RQM59714.1 hypothetical protein EHZ18_09280 [Burkholderia vietnamiensis]